MINIFSRKRKLSLYLVIAFGFEFFVQSVEKQGEELLTIVLLSATKLRISVGQSILEVDRLQLTIFARPNVLKQGTEMIGKT